MNIRPRRNRKSHALRTMVQEAKLGVENLIYPLFIEDGEKIKNEIKSLPNNFRWSLDMILPELESCNKLGLDKFVLFPVVKESLKDKTCNVQLFG